MPKIGVCSTTPLPERCNNATGARKQCRCAQVGIYVSLADMPRSLGFTSSQFHTFCSSIRRNIIRFMRQPF